jgi:hypothetical protein
VSLTIWRWLVWVLVGGVPPGRANHVEDTARRQGAWFPPVDRDDRSH